MDLRPESDFLLYNKFNFFIFFFVSILNVS